MPIFDEDDKGINTTEGFPDFSVTRGYVKREEKKPGISALMKKIPVLSIVLIVLVVLLGGATAYLANKLMILTGEVNEIKGIKGQLSSIQSSVDSSIDAANKERNRLKGEVSQLHNEIDAMKAQQRRQAEVARERQAAAGAKKKAATATKKPQQKERRP